MATTPTAVDAYISAQATAAAQLEALAEAIAQHQDATPADSVNWGHVGDLAHVVELLAEALAFLAPSTFNATPR
jgi:hypothetical protein